PGGVGAAGEIDDDGGPIPGQPQGDGPADASGRPGDQGDLPFEAHDFDPSLPYGSGRQDAVVQVVLARHRLDRLSEAFGREVWTRTGIRSRSSLRRPPRPARRWPAGG